MHLIRTYVCTVLRTVGFSLNFIQSVDREVKTQTHFTDFSVIVIHHVVVLKVHYVCKQQKRKEKKSVFVQCTQCSAPIHQKKQKKQKKMQPKLEDA